MKNIHVVENYNKAAVHKYAAIISLNTLFHDFVLTFILKFLRREYAMERNYTILFSISSLHAENIFLYFTVVLLCDTCICFKGDIYSSIFYNP